MKAEIFTGEIITGHKNISAIETPFDPTEKWGSETRPIWPGRRGHPVTCVLRKIAFDSAIVARMKRHWLLLDPDVVEKLGLAAGDVISVSVKPVGGPRKRAG